MKPLTERWALALAYTSYEDYNDAQCLVYAQGVYEVLLLECEKDSPELLELINLKLDWDNDHVLQLVDVKESSTGYAVLDQMFHNDVMTGVTADVTTG